MKTCPMCGGTGHLPDPDSSQECHAIPCPHCNGTGQVADDWEPPEETPQE